MAEKAKWYDTFNPFARVEADKEKSKKKPKTVPINWDRRVREQSAAKAASRVKPSKSAYQGTPTDPSMDKSKKTTGRKVKVVKPKKRK